MTSALASPPTQVACVEPALDWDGNGQVDEVACP